MSRYHSYLHTACRLIELYDGAIPFVIHAKEYFNANRKIGSTDRKVILSLCYGYFRGGFVFQELSLEEKVIAGLFLTETKLVPVLNALKPLYADNISATLSEKINFIAPGYAEKDFLKSIFPLGEQLSPDVDLLPYCRSLLSQPLLFIRLRPGWETEVMDQLKKQGVSFQKIGDATLSLPSGTRIDPTLVKDKHYVVQDLNSQRIRELFPPLESIQHPCIWDCCAASGGKSLLAWDSYDRPGLTVSDIRKSILQNLQVRLRQAEVPVERMFSADLTLTAHRNGNASYDSGTSFDLVIADVPCTGSGTWARTPEQLVHFKKEQIAVYVEKQRSILRNTVPSIRKGGYLLYVTCSVFRAENEAQVEWLQKEQGLQLIRSACFTGYSNKADTLFAALLTA